MYKDHLHEVKDRVDRLLHAGTLALPRTLTMIFKNLILHHR